MRSEQSVACIYELQQLRKITNPTVPSPTPFPAQNLGSLEVSYEGLFVTIQILREQDEASMRKCAWYIVSLRLGPMHSQVLKFRANTAKCTW